MTEDKTTPDADDGTKFVAEDLVPEYDAFVTAVPARSLKTLFGVFTGQAVPKADAVLAFINVQSFLGSRFAGDPTPTPRVVVFESSAVEPPSDQKCLEAFRTIGFDPAAPDVMPMAGLINKETLKLIMQKLGPIILQLLVGL